MITGPIRKGRDQIVNWYDSHFPEKSRVNSPHTVNEDEFIGDPGPMGQGWCIWHGGKLDVGNDHPHQEEGS